MPPPRQSSLVLMNNATTPILAHQGNVVSRQSGHRTDESIEAPRSRLVACATVHRGRQKRTFRAPVAICSPILCPWGTGTDRHASRRGRPSGGGERGTNCTGQNAIFWGDASSHPAASFTATDPKFHSDENDAAHASACTRRHSTSPRADRSSGTPAGPRLAAAPRSIGQTVQLPLTLRCPAPRRHVERRMGARHRSLAFVPCRVAELAGARTLSTGCGPSACRTLWSSASCLLSPADQSSASCAFLCGR
jgi:hypothetical protein